MRKIYMILISLTLCTFTSGCATTTVHSVSDASSIHSISIVTAIRDTLTMQYIGYIDTNRYVVPVDWGIRKQMDDSLRNNLGGKYEIQESQKDITNDIIVGKNKNRDDLLPADDSLVVDTAKKNLTSGQVDAIIVVFDTEGATYRYRKGGPDFPYYIGMFYKIYVLDGKTFEIKGKEWGSIYRDRVINKYDQPSIDIDLGWRGETYDNVPNSTKDTIRKGVSDLINRSIPFTLKRLNLI